jgi:glucose/arabinose dehydrogenase
MAFRICAFMFALSLAAVVGQAQEYEQPQPPMPPQEQQAIPPEQQAPPPEPAAEPETTSTREVPAEVVSTDAAAKSIQVKVMIKKDASVEPELKEARIRVDEEAVPQLGTVQPGDKVKLTCRMNGKSVIAVKDIKSDKETPREGAPDKTPEP